VRILLQPAHPLTRVNLAAKVAEIALNTSGFKKTVELISKGLVQTPFKEISPFNFSFFRY